MRETRILINLKREREREKKSLHCLLLASHIHYLQEVTKRVRTLTIFTLFKGKHILISSALLCPSTRNITGSWTLIFLRVSWGWFIGFSSFMAGWNPRRSSPQALLLFLGLLLILPILACPADSPEIPSPSSWSHRQLLSSASSLETMELHRELAETSVTTASTKPTATPASHTPSREFEAAAHEVPSGPNPESNK